MVAAALDDAPADAARLLPSNGTPLERALARAASRAALDTLADAPAGLRHTRPAGVAPWQAAEWRLAEFARYFGGTEELIAQGLPWLRQRGSAASVKRALSWIGFDAAVGEDDPHLQLDPGAADAPARLADIRHLAEASLPAHVRLYRLYHGYDLRRARLSGATAMDAAMLSDDSGVWRDGVKLSFGSVHRAGVDAAAGRRIALGRTDGRLDRLYIEDQSRLSVSPYDVAPVLNHRILAGQLITVSNPRPLENPDSISRRRNIRRANIALSDSDEIGAINAVFQRDYWHQPPEVMRLSAAPLSAYDGRIERRPVDEISTLYAGALSFSDVGGALASFAVVEVRSIGAVPTNQPTAQPRVGVEFVRPSLSRFGAVLNPAPAMWAFEGAGPWSQDAATGWEEATPWGSGLRQT
ncbi:phage tail protein [Pseudoduganella namucuonensis]|uniref:Phage tail protein (Tail_P2_I) n=1 Tax=Pseudoduganella namucuonensis TaxID=1035707 RepID=A0A1I7J3C0_9BURK|nr:phage tail protein [Pseudoduganella namucuonensis]SFU79631.1 Phage tail protein (Tail_P2_I) [Pseudoduganella namucuonensis]